MLEQLTQWLLELAVEFFTALWNFVTDAAYFVLQAILNAVVALVAAIPVPVGLQAGLQPLYTMIPPGALYILDAVGVPVAFGIIGGAVVGRLVVRLVTLFQWG